MMAPSSAAASVHSHHSRLTKNNHQDRSETGIVPAKTSQSDRTSSSFSSNTTLRTLADIRTQVAQEVAIHAITKAEVIDGVKVGVILTLSKQDDEEFLNEVVSSVRHTLLLQKYLFAVASTGTQPHSNANALIISGSSDEFVQKAVLLTSSKFLGRVQVVNNDGNKWIAVVQDMGTSVYDEEALWDVVHKSVRKPMDPLTPPPGSRGIEAILGHARSKLQRLTPKQAYEELHDPTMSGPVFLVDIRPAAQREVEGGIHGSLIIERNVLEWRFDPRSMSRLTIVDQYDLRVIVFCQDGSASSLAAVSLHQLGLLNATDIVGGYRGWKEAELPVDTGPPTPQPSTGMFS